MTEIKTKLEKNHLQLSQAEASQDLSQEEELLKQKVEALSEEAQKQASAKRDLEANYKVAVAPIRQMEREYHQLIQRDIPQAQLHLQQAQDQLRDARRHIQELAGSAESHEAQRAMKLQQYEEHLQNAKEKYNETKQAVTNALHAYEELEPQVEQAKQQVGQVQRRLDSIQRKMEELNTSQTGDALAVFGAKCSRMRQLVRAKSETTTTKSWLMKR
jgi:chromosome segregation ATPase